MKLTTSKGRSVDSQFATHAEAAAALRDLLHKEKLGGSAGFAASLLNHFERNRISPDQLAWIHILCEQSKPKPTSRGSIDFHRINLLFACAQSKGLKNMRIRGPGFVVRIGFSGHLVVIRTSTERKLIAEVRENLLLLGEFVTKEEEADLTKLAEDPLNFAVVYGTRTGSCMFCGLTLTTAASVGSGYGPICAEHWGLPWADSAGAKHEKAMRQLLLLKEKLQAEGIKVQ